MKYLFQEKEAIYCDGFQYNGTLSTCTRPDEKPLKFCNFKNGDLCGWSQPFSQLNGLKWSTVESLNGPENATIGTGVQTFSPYTDHFMHFDATGFEAGTTAGLFSPVFNPIPENTDPCFSFKFSMWGKNMGTLGLYVMPESDENFNNKDPIAKFEGNQGYRKIIRTIPLSPWRPSGTFQLAFLAERGSSYLSDMELDYVQLILNDPLKCSKLISSNNLNKVQSNGNDELSPESCQNRCYKNVTKPWWNEGFCTCLEQDEDCHDFKDLCTSIISKPPEFLKHFGLHSWTHVSMALSVGIFGVIILVLGVYYFAKKRSSESIVQRTKREGVSEVLCSNIRKYKIGMILPKIHNILIQNKPRDNFFPKHGRFCYHENARRNQKEDLQRHEK